MDVNTDRGMRAEQLLQSAVTLHEAPLRDGPVPAHFRSLSHAVGVMTDVLLHEARESLQDPLAARPEQPYLHPVDVDTAEPGIVASRTSLEILRVPGDEVTRIGYRALEREDAVPERGVPTETEEEEMHVVVSRTPRASERAAERQMASAIRRGERSAQTDERRRERKRERAEETPEARERRLQEQRETREARARRTVETDEEQDSKPPPPPPRRRQSCSDPFPDASMNDVIRRPRAPPARARGCERFYQHPLPHHRHLAALRRVSPHPSLLNALLHAETSEALEIIQGPPGTGKTTRLVDCLARLSGRVLLCAPTNVGAANLYERCVQRGYASECALSLAPDRIPPGTAVQSNDPARRIVCATISSRSGPILDAHIFESVLVDEAAQCMEAWVWTLLRPEVAFLALAGDVRQLPALVSETGRTLGHERSLMERLAARRYDNTTVLTVQNRMCPEILALTNDRFYEGRLTCGPHAPPGGTVEFVDVDGGGEEEDGTSYANVVEVDAVEALCSTGDLGEDAVILCPYVAQCRRILSRGLGVAVHTIDSFQGREADTVVVSMVRDGSTGLGFWSDPRRLVVALTRARRRLVIVVSNRQTSWTTVL